MFFKAKQVFIIFSGFFVFIKGTSEKAGLKQEDDTVAESRKKEKKNYDLNGQVEFYRYFFPVVSEENTPDEKDKIDGELGKDCFDELYTETEECSFTETHSIHITTTETVTMACSDPVTTTICSEQIKTVHPDPKKIYNAIEVNVKRSLADEKDKKKYCQIKEKIKCNVVGKRKKGNGLN